MKMKPVLWSLVLVLALGLSACGTGSAEAPGTSAPVTSAPDASAATPAPAAEDGAGTEALSDLLPSDYADALSARNQLALGTLRLEGTEHAVTPEQAQTLSFLWQGLKALGGDSMAASEETAAVQQQIEEAMTEAQLQAIRDLQLTSVDLNAFYEEQGLPIPTPNPENPDAVPGSQQGRNMTDEERAARRAAREAAGEAPVEGGGGGAGAARRDALMDAVIALLVERAG